jgi:uncharacterized protein (UPF0303 family)
VRQSHCGVASYIKKDLKAKEEELWKLKYFTMQKLYNLQKKMKNPPKETKKSFKIDIRTQELISSFNTSQKISSFKNPQKLNKNRPIIIT